jgi:uncharacterized protein YhaN
MRLTALTLTRYGNFDSVRIGFDPQPGRLNLLLAPNGAGKSVLRAAFCDLLFGIGGQTPMGFRYGYGNMRLTAEALTADGTRFVFGRRKGNRNTLLDADGAELNPAALARWLGATDRTLLERLYALDTERLRQGEKELLSSNGALGDALESGGGGFHHARRLKAELEESRDALAPLRRSGSRPFYQQADTFAAARQVIRRDALRPEEAARRQDALEAARTRQQEQNAVADEASAEIARLERVRRVMPWLGARDAAAAWLAEHPEAPVLDAGLGARLDDCRLRIVIAEDKRSRARTDADRLAEALEGISVDAVVLGEAAAIEALNDPEGAVRKALLDMPGVEAQAAARRQAVAARLRDLGSELEPGRAGELVPPRAVATRARRLLRDYAARQQAAGDAPTRVAAAERDRAAALAQLATLPEAADLSALETLVRAIRTEGDPARREADAAAALAEADSVLAEALARVPGWDQGAEALLAVAPLTADHYQRMDDERAAARTEADRRRDTLQAARETRQAAQARLAATTGPAPLADEAGLRHVRERRDAGWQLIYRRAFTADPPSAAEEQAFAHALPLPIAYERAVSAADAMADRRVQEADQIAAVQAAQAALQEAEVRVQAAEQAHRLAEETAAATARQWSQVCARLPLGPEPRLREVLDFRGSRERVIEARQRHTAAATAQRALLDRHADWSVRLGALLGTDPLPATLAAGLAVAEQRLEAGHRTETARAGAEARRAAAEKTLTEAQAGQRDAAAALEAWRTDWVPARAALGRPADEDPDVTADMLSVLDDLAQTQAELAGLDERVAGMRRESEAFATRVRDLVQRAAPDLAEADTFAMASNLRKRLQQARAALRDRERLTEELGTASETAEAADRDLADAQAEQAAVLLLIGAPDPAAAAVRLALAAERATQAAALAEAEGRLRQAGDLLPLATLRAEVAAVPADEITQRIDHAVQRRQAAQAAAQEAAAQASALHQQITAAAADTSVLAAAADQQAAAASLGRVLEDALVYHLAAEMLDRALKAKEQSTDNAALRRIGTLFSRLTAGAYTRVLSAPDDAGTLRLELEQRAWPNERQTAAELSEGTRDQLFLALRLAAIEAQARAAPPLPFLGDDILQTFDDDRAVAALDVLREVSETVQVILLTHHRHVLDLAGQLPDGSVHVCRMEEMSV